MGDFATWLYYLFIKIFVYCIIIVQIANKVGCNKKNNNLWPIYWLSFVYAHYE
jgi:hypothetical protein